LRHLVDSRKLSGFLLLVLCALPFSASAAPGPTTYNFSSVTYVHIGEVFDVPIAGGPVACTGSAMTGCVAGQKPSMSPPPAAGTVMAMGSSPATFTLQSYVGTLVPTQSTVAFPNNPTAIQLATAIGAVGPVASNMTDTPASGYTRIMRPNAWMDQPGRMAADFSWCPGGPNPNCIAANLGALPQRVRYVTNPNAFGGTASNLANGTGALSIIIGTTQGVPLVVNAPLSLPTTHAQVDGRFYSATSTLMIGSGLIHIGYMTNTPCTASLPPTPQGCGQIASLGPVAPTPFPPQTNYNYGFPLTTAFVSLQKTGTNQGTPTTTTLTAAGTDSRTPLGRGQITLVAGGSINRQIPALGVSQDGMRMTVSVYTIVDPPSSPALGPAGLATGATLILLAGGYAFRRRL